MATAKPRRPRVLLVDDHEIVRLGLRAVLERAGMNVVAEAANGREAIRAVHAAKPEVTHRWGREAARSQRRRSVPRNTVGVSGRQNSLPDCLSNTDMRGRTDRDGSLTLLPLSVLLLLKEIGSDNLVEAIRMVESGLTVMKPDMNRSAVERLHSLSIGQSLPGSELSPQERRALALVAEGKTNKEIGAAMKLSPKTVKNYLSRVFQKLQVTRRSEAVSRVMQEAAQYGRSSSSA